MSSVYSYNFYYCSPPLCLPPSLSLSLSLSLSQIDAIQSQIFNDRPNGYTVYITKFFQVIKRNFLRVISSAPKDIKPSKYRQRIFLWTVNAA